MGWTTCWKCKEKFGLADETEATLRRSGGTFCCPWGHTAHFPAGKTEAEKLREQLEEERLRRQRAEQRVAERADEAATAWRTASAYKGVATRVRNRAKAGVCPCCNRTFQNMARHMQSKHPGFTPEPPALEVIDGGKTSAA